MDKLRQCYETLGIIPGASVEEIKQAYKDSVKVWHPDRFENDPRLKQKAQEKIKDINAAYEKIANYFKEYGTPHFSVPDAQKQQEPPSKPYQEPPRESVKTEDSADVNKASKARNQKTQSIPKGNPWRRYWARTIDTMLLSLPVALLFGLLFPEFCAKIVERSGGAVGATYPLYIIILPFIMLAEACILGVTGTTFGKWLLNITLVRKVDGNSITFSEALRRSILVWIKGLAFGLPLICLIPMGLAAGRIKKNITASWDDSISADVQCEPLQIWRICLAVFLIAVLLTVNGVLQEFTKSRLPPAPAPAVGADIWAGLTEPNAPAPAPAPAVGVDVWTAVNFDPFLKSAQPETGFIIGDDVVTDTQTGLMWARNGNIAGRPMNWNGAMSWVKKLNYGGYYDWRLPTNEELMALATRGGERRSDWFNVNGFNNVQAQDYWTSSTYSVKGETIYGMVQFGDGGDNNKTVDLYVWPVRSGR